MNRLPGYEGCLFCGPEHPHGLRLRMHYREGMVVAEVSVPRLFQGYDDVVHGGIVAGLLDEVMWWAVTIETRKLSMTGKAEIEYLNVLKCGLPHVVRGKFIKMRHDTFFAEGEIEGPSERTVARGKGLFRPVKAISGSEFLKKMDLTQVSPQMREIFYSLPEHHPASSLPR
jgi:acyl-coenzyme A thioesterase PaaI-like protein